MMKNWLASLLYIKTVSAKPTRPQRMSHTSRVAREIWTFLDVGVLFRSISQLIVQILDTLRF